MPMEPNQRHEQYIELRERWPVFHYHGWTLADTAAGTRVTSGSRSPSRGIRTDPDLSQYVVRPRPCQFADSPLGRRILFRWVWWNW
jgi:hypothetical protein